MGRYISSLLRLPPGGEFTAGAFGVQKAERAALRQAGGCLRGGRHSMSCYDMLMTVAPGNLVTLGVLALALFACLSSLAQPAFIT